jgi:sugar lactone lactonase YvrE
MKAELFLDARAERAEGPVWDTTHGRLLWVDILAGHVHATTPDGDDTIIWETGTTVGCVAPQADGSWIVAERDRLTRVADWTDRTELVTLPIPDTVRTNDGKLDPHGRMVVGTMAFDATTDAGTLFSWDGTTLATLRAPVTISNGLAWSADGATLYYIDTPTQQIAAFDYRDDGSLGDRRVVVDIDEADGSPDGMTIDNDGALWVALWGGSQVRRYLPDGTLDEIVHVDATNVSCCTFAPDGTLYITTARTDSPNNPGDGAIFRTPTGRAPSQRRPARSAES